MNRRFVLSGSLVLLLLPAKIGAAGDRYADLTPISPYVRQVVERVEQSLPGGQGTASTTDRTALLLWWNQITGIVLGTIDTNLRVVEQERDIFARSPCLHIDTLILEGWMERARLRKIQALRSGDSAEAARLVSIQLYLNDRYAALLRGAHDPTYEDPDEGMFFGFDRPPLWCCPASASPGNAKQCASVSGDAVRECTQKNGRLSKRHFSCVSLGCEATAGSLDPREEEAPCPFDTDYLPPTSAGYGCDATVLAPYANDVPEGLRREIEALQTLTADRDALIHGMAAARDTVAYLEQQLGGGGTDLSNFGAGASDRRTHRRISGCFMEGEELPPEVGAGESRGPFSFAREHITAMMRLAAVWRDWGVLRLPPEYLRPSRYLREGSPEQQVMRRWETGMGGWFFLIARNNADSFLVEVSERQAEEESAQIAAVIDAPQRVMQSIRPLREEVQTLAGAATSSDEGLRKFARDFAAFLRVSCVFRPCNEQLDRVLKIVFADECFPYVNGAALEDDVAEQCRRSAGL